ncbi:hypothetical protein GGI25_001586 [Coemansia spiralis]|uniref:Cation/H+ exchanger transmembrane domain-containing protein n=2 Tax=Coemansia TaxID=4863 RepID=A0A9W8GCM2_9FUNG|nr:hypothetical protein EDC05_002088 [Coemansia umbellata]KAJ2622938.1 hypothetical protein GGI26_002739 [Coemansia sp. RSA 1358]KAJ2679451.1 hypothetical protein GGI25_001586 [Coemansia spiralis]
MHTSKALFVSNNSSWIHLNLGPSATVPLLLGTFAVFFGLISMVVKEWLFVSDTLVALLFGILFGPAGLDAVNPADWIDVHSFTLEFTRLIIAIQVMAAGITLPKKYLRDELKSLLVLLGPVMIWMWLTSAVIIMLVFRLSLLESLLIASCVAPTDPVLANSIVRGRFAETKVPQHVRNIISAESGANDGLGYPYLYLALYLLKFTTSSEAITRWFVVVVVWEIVMSIVFGAIIGWAARKLLQFARKKSWVDHDSFLSFAISLTLLTLGTVALVGSDDILACFIAGNAFTWDGWFTEETKQAHFQDVLDTVFNFTFFIYLGAIIPWKKLAEGMEMLTTSRLVAAAVLIILFRRLPMTLAVTRLTPAIKTFREAVFAGWFGPIGVGAVFYAMVAYEELQDEAFDGLAVKEYLFPIVYTLVTASVFVHGVTIPFYHIVNAVPNATAAVSRFLSRTPSQSSSNIFIFGSRVQSTDSPSPLPVYSNAAPTLISSNKAATLQRRVLGLETSPLSSSCPPDSGSTLLNSRTTSTTRRPVDLANYGSIGNRSGTD